MRKYLSGLVMLAGTGVMMTAVPAYAGSCNSGQSCAAPAPCGSSTNPCAAKIVVEPHTPRKPDPVRIHTSEPLDHMRAFELSGEPHVNITRIYGQKPSVTLEDVPSEFTNGCNPRSTRYCGKHTPKQKPAPVVQMRPFVTMQPHVRMQRVVEMKPVVNMRPVLVDPSAPNPCAAPTPTPPSAPCVSTGHIASAPQIAAPYQAPVPRQYSSSQGWSNLSPQVPSSGAWQNVSGPKTLQGGGFTTGVFCNAPRHPSVPPAPGCVPAHGSAQHGYSRYASSRY